jgi:hypothetical protein
VAQTYRQNPQELDLEITHGEPWSMAFTVNVDVGGYTFESAVVLNNGIVVPITTGVRSVIDEVSTIALRLEDAAVTALQLGEARWFFKWVPPGGDERTILSGAVRIERGAS